LRGKAADALEPFCCDTGYGAQARGHANRAFEAEWGKPQPTAKPVCSEPRIRACVMRWPKPRQDTERWHR
jgi:hypothetical protein